MPGPIFTDQAEGAALHVRVRVEKYRPGRKPVGLPDEVVERTYWVDTKTGREITDPERIVRLEAKLKGVDSRAPDQRLP